MIDLDFLQNLRHTRWCQTAETRIANPEAGKRLIEQVGICSLFEASPEIPNLYLAFMGAPKAEVSSSWDSPAGEMYSWRWKLGRPEAAFYTTLVRGRPTWISWALVPAILRLRGQVETTAHDLYEAGQLGTNAYRVAQALEASETGVLPTGELRKAAGFERGQKEQRAVYLKAVEELDNLLLVAKVFAQDKDDMSHALVSRRYAEQVVAAHKLKRAEALHQLLLVYLPTAIYAQPDLLAKHLKIPAAELYAGFASLVEAGLAQEIRLPGHKGPCYVWDEATKRS